MTGKTVHRGRTLYLNPARSPLEAELDELLKNTYRSQALMRGYLLAGYALAKEGITWDVITHRLVHGNDPVRWSSKSQESDTLGQREYASPAAHVPVERVQAAVEVAPVQPEANKAAPMATETPNEQGRSVRDKFAALTRGA